MAADDQVRFLAKALERLLLKPDEADELRRSLGENDSAAKLAVERGLLSHEQAREIERVAGDDRIDNTADYVPVQEDSSPPTTAPSVGSSIRPSLESSQRINDVPRFTLLEEIGRGGMGVVWRAHDEHVDRDVAVKEMRPTKHLSTPQVMQFLLEAQVTGRLEHPGIVPIHEVGVKPDGAPFYVMKWLKGRTLGEAIAAYHRRDLHDRERPIEFNRLLSAFVDICQAVAFAHKRDVLHRDLKPGNIVLGEFGEAVVVDWGLAKVLDRGQTSLGGAFSPSGGSAVETDSPWSTAGSIKGTLPYMSPEQASGDNDRVGRATDVYALGAIFYEILCGKRAFSGKVPEQVRAEVRAGKFTAPRRELADVPRPLEAVCLKAMSLEPADRYHSARELAEEIDRWRSGEPVAAYPEPLVVRTGRWVRKHRTLCDSVATAATLLTVALVGYDSLESARVATLQLRADDAMRTGRQALIEERLDEAAIQLAKARAVALEERRLSDRLQETESLQSALDVRLKDREARRDSRERMKKFVAAYDDALYYGSASFENDLRLNLERSRLESIAALKLFGVDPPAALPPVLDERYYNPAERNEVVRKTRELLALVADVVGYPLPESAPNEQALRSAEAVTILDQAQKWGDPLRSVGLRRAFFLRASGRVDDANAAEVAAQSLPLQDADHFLLGESAFAADRPAEAGEHFERALRADPANFWAQYLLALCRVRLRNFDEAIALLDGCQVRRPEFPGTFIARGFVHGERGDLKAALADFTRADDLCRDDQGGAYEVALNRGVARLRNGREDDAIVDFRRAAELRPKLGAPLVNLAEAHYSAGRRDQALEQLKAALKAEPTSVAAYRSRARIHNADGRLDESLQDLEAAIRFERPGSRTSAQTLAEKGRLLQRRNDQAGALKAYSQVLSDRPDFVDALFLRALLLIDMNRDADAIADLNLFLTRSRLAERAHRPTVDDEVARTRAATKVTADSPTLPSEPKRLLAAVYRERGLAYQKTGDENAALRDYSAAAALVENADGLSIEYDRNRFALMHSRHGWALLLHAQTLAIDEFSAAIKSGRPNGEPHAGRGFAYAVSSRVPEAIADAELAAKLGPSHPEHYHNIACIYAQLFGKSRAEQGDDVVKRQSAAFRTSAIEMLTKAFELVPPEQRAAFLKHSLSDPALDPLRKESQFQDAIRTFTAMSEKQ